MSGKHNGHPAASVGGQAVIEGVMMRGKRHWALACRRPDGTISLHSEALDPLADRYPILKWPILRGIIALWESLSLGIRTLGMSANESLGEEEHDITKKEMALSLGIGIVMAVALFVVLPLAAVGSIKGAFPDWMIETDLPILGTHQFKFGDWLFVFTEGLVRIVILVLYILVVSRLKQLRRVFEYHGAEHQTIHALEAGLELTPANVNSFSPVHPRCGTSFLLIVMVVAIIIFPFVGTSPIWWLIVSRLIGIPMIVGISYEVIKFAGKHKDNTFMKIIMYPGMALQRLTTRKPDDSQIEVAISAIEGVAALEPIEMDHGGQADVEVMA